MRSYIAVIFIALVTVSLLAGCGTPQACPKIGDKAPDFTLSSIDGKTISLNSYAGKSIVINTWDLDCPRCREEMPFFQDLYNKYFQNQAVFISINTGSDNTGSIKDYLKQNSYTFGVLQDYGSKVFKSKYCFTGGNPYTVFVDSNGIIKDIKIGSFVTKQDLENKIVSLIAH